MGVGLGVGEGVGDGVGLAVGVGLGLGDGDRVGAGLGGGGGGIWGVVVNPGRGSSLNSVTVGIGTAGSQTPSAPWTVPSGQEMVGTAVGTSSSGFTKSVSSVPRSAVCMKLFQMVAGNDPPVTRRPRTLVISGICPVSFGGNPIQTTAVRSGV